MGQIILGQYSVHMIFDTFSTKYEKIRDILFFVLFQVSFKVSILTTKVELHIHLYMYVCIISTRSSVFNSIRAFADMHMYSTL